MKDRAMPNVEEIISGLTEHLPTNLAIHILRNLGIRQELTGYHSEIDSEIKELLEKTLENIGQVIVDFDCLGRNKPAYFTRYPYLYRFHSNDTNREIVKKRYLDVKQELSRTCLNLGIELCFLNNEPGFIFVRLTPKYRRQKVTSSGESSNINVV